ncbi:2-succinyl-6-hydroxy-2,4-cyclohexadiene-1-carboxylate synthase [Bacillus suaedaesalsae]|uniref:Putative 2-succinyl-6-hydroxy-2,4-cyclohexadiene-1-carboxylate synthase n=1 Tax=Bacillus suaedaesalsae TaxID=2810349 RepID=A0ABS2DHT7_9BACI|nr:2-succinyl-6-hydroxy-2,4-cyclohexadiene-1-carboxylate synthase [Bacillus suaedaesalsae]MBM6618052.1 2-succinyl-6-hydroxy-2,4-cyclohexadiene-1-carboxylate synthase [Bacillus suaedaesalsae]
MKKQINGVTYSFKMDGTGPAALLLHGFTGCKENWNNLQTLLSAQYQVITVDLIGHGKTDSPKDIERYKIESVCEDLKSLLVELNLKKVHILGYSMGGRVALAFACIYPEFVQSLTLESSSPGIQNEEDKKNRVSADEKLATKIEEEGVEAFIDFWEGIPLFETQRKLSLKKQLSIRSRRLQNNPIGLANSLRGMGTGKQPSYWDELSSINVPILLLCGELDEKFCFIAENMNKKLQNATINKVMAVGHAIHVEQPRIFGKIVLEHIQQNT